MIAAKKTAGAVTLAFSTPFVFAQEVSNSTRPSELAPVIVTANPLGSALFDLAAPVSVLGGRDLTLQRQSTLGETVANLPGVSATYFGPAASRPVIRGLDSDRIRILYNGTGALDVSALSPDHATTTDPLVADQIEVVRGPAALLYGGTAVGGVVNVLNNRIPQEAILGVTGRFEPRFGGADNERSGAAVFEGGNGRIAFHADISARNNDDVRIPGYARSKRQRALDGSGQDQPRGHLPNSSARGESGALGASLTLDKGYAGLSYSDFATNYGSVAEPDVRLEMKSSRWDAAGELREIGSFIESVKFKYGYTDYQHQELESGAVSTTFKNKGYEGRIEATHATLGPLTGAFGIQFSSVDFSALGEESLLPKLTTDSGALFLYEEAAFGRTKYTFGWRLEQIKVASQGGGPLDPNTGLPRFGSEQTRSFSDQSGSAGIHYRLSQGLNLAATLSHTERAPTYAELFTNGPHAATGQYEIGGTNLTKEKSDGLDLQLRWRLGQHSASIGGFYNRFQNYIAVMSSGNTRGTDGELSPVDANGDRIADVSGRKILPEGLYRTVKADFQGVEAEGKFRVYEGSSDLDLRLRGDYVRATNRDTGEPLPRISPLRLGMGLDYQLGKFATRLDVIHAFKQDRIAANELPTDGYTLVNAALTYRIKADTMNLEAFFKGNNLFNQDVRVHTSFLKDIAPLPGRGFLIGVRGTF